jgi:hypothetical protein
MSAERWVPILGGRYDVSDHGNVRAWFSSRGKRATPRPCKPYREKTGYLTFGLVPTPTEGPLHFMAHRLVCEAFHGAPPDENAQVRHFDGNRANNVWTNLSWGTAADNAQDRIRHGTMPRGESHSCHKLTEAAVLELRAASKTGETATSLAARFGIGVTHALRVIRRESWAHLPEAA